jgi:hypothetical protein
MPAISLEEIDKLLRVKTRRWNVEAKRLQGKNISCLALGGPDVRMGESGIRVIFNFWSYSNTTFLKFVGLGNLNLPRTSSKLHAVICTLPSGDSVTNESKFNSENYVFLASPMEKAMQKAKA